ncbi:MAG TPA: exodeoxyribonuclease VII small subunit [Treponemataceae bacterium]|jgi:exodeoxyribonuclease VII small subunit|nr:exodeoxyribonuclease VII small subunit [Treponemataceae bacterium]HPX25895.1 exodeoxyribonuclease VII small subunit [Treponemataceae bacterium]
MESFEKRLERLENLNSSIKKSDLPMEDALKLFEEGIKLAKSMEKDLDKIESKIQILMNQPASVQEKPELDLFSAIDND